jgi:hypothetical protein
VKLGLVLLLAALATSLEAGPYDPTLQFRTCRTPHFLIHFHQTEEEAAARLARIVERVHASLTRQLGHLPSGPTHVVLVHQSDQSNGATIVVPWNAIEINAVPPTGADAIGNTDDWLTYVFTHEYAHVLHLDRSRSWAKAARAIFGRTEIAFPNLSLPEWQIEGFATWVESQNGQGRLNAGAFREIVDAAARDRRLEPIDRINGGLVDWPSSDGWYAYGARFHEYLAKKYGAERLATLADRTSGRLFFTSGAFKAVYGKSLGALWREFEAAQIADSARPGDRGLRATELTHLGFLVSTPGVDADGTVWFTASDPDRFPALCRLRAGQSDPERVAERYGGTGLTLGANVAIFDQLEFARGAGLASDLYALDRATGRVRRLTKDARLVDPTVSPDGTRLAVVRTRPGARELLVLDATRLLASTAPMSPASLPVLSRLGGPYDVFAGPRWSPDGTRLAVEHRALNGPSEIVVLGADLEAAGPVLSSPRGRTVTPEWTRDGRGLYFSSDRDGGNFAIFEASWTSASGAASVVRLFAPAGGALSPTRMPDGRLVFVGYTTDGYDLFSVVLPDRAGALPAGPATQSASVIVPTSPAGATRPVLVPTDVVDPAAAAAGPYRPWSSLWPRGWLPIVEQRNDRWRLGGSVTGEDVLGRHVVGASASWAVSSRHPASTLVPAGRPDWLASYTYQRWQTSPFVVAEDRTSLFEAFTGTGDLVPVAQRDRQIDAGIVRSFRRVRWAQSVLGSVHFDRVATDTETSTASVHRAGLRGAWTATSAQRYGYSISPEDGFRSALTAERLGEITGAGGDASAVTGDVRVYLPLGFRHAVFAARVAGAQSSGDRGVRRVFRLGGSDGDTLGGFGDDAISLLRGFERGVFSGTHVALANLEARMPLVWPQRGAGTWPIFLRSIHAAMFADVGNAWTSASRWRDRKAGLGAELSTDVTLWFGVPVTWTAGVAWGHDGSGQLPDQRSVYFRVGPSF